MKSRKQCQKELVGVEETDFGKFVFVDEMMLKCFEYCTFKKMQYLNENGKIRHDKLEEISIKYGTKINKIKKCLVMYDKMDKKCDYAENMFRCIADI